METQRAFSVRGPARWLAALNCLRIAAIVGEPANDNFEDDPPPAAAARAGGAASTNDSELWEKRRVAI